LVVFAPEKGRIYNVFFAGEWLPMKVLSSTWDETDWLCRLEICNVPADYEMQGQLNLRWKYILRSHERAELDRYKTSPPWSK
jgi:hypothetical protein